MELDPGGPSALALALLYFDLGDDNKFFETTAQAAKRWPDDAEISQVAMVNLIRLDTTGAVRQAQRAFDVNRRTPGL